MDNVIKKTICHRKNKPSIALKKKKKFRRRRAFLHPPWKNPGYGPDQKHLELTNIMF